MRLLHDPAKTHASFDGPNLVSRAGLVPVMALAERCGLTNLVGEHVRIGAKCGVNADLKAGCRDLIDVAARIARHGRGHITVHLPEGWHCDCQWMNLFEAACGPPRARPA